MAKTKKEKKKIIGEIEDYLDRQKAVYFVNFKGLGADDLFQLRRRLKQEKAQLYVAKKTLTRIAFENKKLPLPDEGLEGQLGLVFGLEDQISPAKIVHDLYEEKGTPEILGGVMEEELITKQRAVMLAQLPSQEELRTRLLNTMQAPLYNLRNNLENPIKGLLFILNAEAS